MNAFLWRTVDAAVDGLMLVSGRSADGGWRRHEDTRAGRRIVTRRASWAIGAVLILFGGLFASPLPARGDSIGPNAPAATAAGQFSGFTNATDASTCNDVVATATTNNQSQFFYNFGFNSIPGNAIITGIQVRVRATDGSSRNRKLQLALSWDGGATFTANLNTRNFRANAPLTDFIVGGSAVLWGRTWTPAEFSDTNFRVRVTARKPGASGNDIQLDCLPVTVFYRIPGAPNLSIAKIDSPDPVQPLQTITYTISYGNTGESTATGVTITDTTPANTTFVSASPTATGAPAVGGTGPVTWSVADLPQGGTGFVVLTVQVNSGVNDGALIVNDTYSIASDQTSPTAGNAAITTVQGTISLTMQKSGSPNPVAPGATLTYTLTIHNAGNVPSNNLVVDESYDGNVTFASESSAPSGCAALVPSADDQWTIASLAVNDTCTITILTAVHSPLADGVQLLNQADLVDDAGHTASASTITNVDNPAVCGDGVVKAPTEECDVPGENGASSSCCTASCQFRAGGQECRPAVDECDAAETCSGSAATCPADGFVGAGIGCPDDGNVCTDDECDGAGGCQHPDNTAACDDAIFCNGSDTCSGGSCVVHAGDPCSGGAECNDSCNETAGNCAVSAGIPCTDEGNVCTDDECDGAGTCGHPPNTIACDDGNICTVNDACSGGSCGGESVECGDGTLQIGCSEQCDDGNTVSGDGCSSTCTLEPCGPEPEPATACKQPATAHKAFLLLKDKVPNDRDRLLWRWIRGTATQKNDFGAPLVDSSYQFCIYQATAPRLVLSAGAPAGGMCAGRSCWAENRHGFTYKDKDLSPDGLAQVVLKEGAQDKAKILVKGKGTTTLPGNLAMPNLANLTSPVIVQLKDLNTGKCWQATYSAPFLRQQPDQFKAKAD
jgi:uncharacterized repeat protein (TIGR01451 family)